MEYSLEHDKKLLRSLFEAAIASVDPARCLAPFLPAPPRGRTVVVGAGKASAAMAQAVESNWPGPLEGLVLTPYGHGVSCQRIEILEAAHPVPDAAGMVGAGRILGMLSGLTPDDLVLALMSGGGSSLLTLPAGGLTLADKRAVNLALLKSGAPISEINIVRKHLSAIKGGRLGAAAFPARVVTLVVSDIPGDDLAAVASGPTAADASSFADARAIVARYQLDFPPAVMDRLAGDADETPFPGDQRLKSAEIHCIASPQMALEAAAAVARTHGINSLILGDALEGEAREVGRVMAGIARQVQRFGQPIAPPCVLLSGGETTVTVRGTGAGGRNVEFLLALALNLRGRHGITALAGDTDGIDGTSQVAGAIIDSSTLERASAAGFDAAAALANNDAHSFFQALKNQIVTGPTLTNVNDFRAILVR